MKRLCLFFTYLQCTRWYQYNTLQLTLWYHNHFNSYCRWLKSCTTWDVWNLVHNGINYLSTGAGFLLSTVAASKCSAKKQLLPGDVKGAAPPPGSSSKALSSAMSVEKWISGLSIPGYHPENDHVSPTKGSWEDDDFPSFSPGPDMLLVWGSGYATLNYSVL